jgi:TolA-binding protein
MKRFRGWFVAVVLAMVSLGSGCSCRRSGPETLTPGGDSAGRPGGRPGQTAEDPRSSAPGRIQLLPEGAEAGVLGAGPGVGGPGGDKAGHSRFQQAYYQGIGFMEKGSYGEAIQVFERIVADFPNSEEASIAEYCIAEIHFRNKSNPAALAAFKRVVERYPNSQAAENARAGITYIESFSAYESEYVSPDVEDRQRRGR